MRCWLYLIREMASLSRRELRIFNSLLFADLAVVIGSEIDFFARNKTLVGQANVGEAVALTGVTYDDTTRTMYLSDIKNNVSIFSNDLTEKNFTSTPLLRSKYRTN